MPWRWRWLKFGLYGIQGESDVLHAVSRRLLLWMQEPWLKGMPSDRALGVISEERSCVCVLSPVQLFKTPWTVACQAPLSMEFSRQEYWSGLPCPPLGDLPNLGIEHPSLMSPVLAGGFLTTSSTWEAPREIMEILKKGELCSGDKRVEPSQKV